MSKKHKTDKFKAEVKGEVVRKMIDDLYNLVHQAKRHVPLANRGWHERAHQFAVLLISDPVTGEIPAETGMAVDKGAYAS